jgi:hypothetical protein
MRRVSTASVKSIQRKWYRTNHGGHWGHGERQYKSDPVSPVLPVVDTIFAALTQLFVASSLTMGMFT